MEKTTTIKEVIAKYNGLVPKTENQKIIFEKFQKLLEKDYIFENLG